MKTVNKLDYLYRKLVVKAREQEKETIDITDEEYGKYYEEESNYKGGINLCINLNNHHESLLEKAILNKEMWCKINIIQRNNILNLDCTNINGEYDVIIITTSIEYERIGSLDNKNLIIGINNNGELCCYDGTNKNLEELNDDIQYIQYYCQLIQNKLYIFTGIK